MSNRMQHSKVKMIMNLPTWILLKQAAYIADVTGKYCILKSSATYAKDK
jgi:hypothetical protein